MPSQGPNATGSWFTDATGAVPWINPTNAQFSDNIYSTATILNLDDVSDALVGDTWGFAVPAGATINGFIFSVEVKGTGGIADVGVFLAKPGPVFSVNKATITPLPGVDTLISYGGAADLWGLGPVTFADVNSPAFRGQYTVLNISGVAETASVDQGLLTVFFTPAATGRVQWQIMGVGAPQ